MDKIGRDNSSSSGVTFEECNVWRLPLYKYTVFVLISVLNILYGMETLNEHNRETILGPT